MPTPGSGAAKGQSPLAPPLPPPSVSSLIAVISRAPASLGQGDRWSARGRGAAQVPWSPASLKKPRAQMLDPVEETTNHQ